MVTRKKQVNKWRFFFFRTTFVARKISDAVKVLPINFSGRFLGSVLQVTAEVSTDGTAGADDGALLRLLKSVS